MDTELLDYIKSLEGRIKELERREVSRFSKLNVGLSGTKAGAGDLIVDGQLAIGDDDGFPVGERLHIEGVHPRIVIVNSNETDPAGRWTIEAEEDDLNFYRVSGAGFSSYDKYLRINPDGTLTIFNLADFIDNVRISNGVVEHNKANESVNGQAAIRVRDMGVINTTHNWMVEVVMTNFDIPANATTAFSFLDLDDYGTAIRGGYSIFGNMVFDDETGSNVGSIVFHGHVRSTGAGTESSQTGAILSSLGTGSNITAFLPRINTANDNLRVQFTNANATRAMQNCVLQMIVMGQAL